MYAIEFEAPIQHGVVHIPIRYKELQETSSAKFIVMFNEPIDSSVLSSEKMDKSLDDIDVVFNKFEIDMSDFRFDRDEANER
jgi:hypothetical protein